MNADKLEKWNRWIGDVNDEGRIGKELCDLAVVREVYAGVKDMVAANPALQRHSAFHSVFALNYAHSVLMYVRRQVQPDKDSANLVMLALDLQRNAEMVTREFYVGLYTEGTEGEERKRQEGTGQYDFARHFGGAVGTHLDPALIQRDVDDLQAVLDASSGYTNRRVAHLDRREPTRVPQRSEMEEWCEVLNDKLQRFSLLLQGSTYPIEPGLTHDWRAIFHEAWLPESPAD